MYCQPDDVCCDNACYTPLCDIQHIEGLHICPGGTATLSFTTACSPPCNNESFRLDVAEPPAGVSISSSNPIACDGIYQTGNLQVTLTDEGAQGTIELDVTGGANTCSTPVTLEITPITDIFIPGFGEGNEENPGLVVCQNSDDDNGDDVVDSSGPGQVIGEDDLSPFWLAGPSASVDVSDGTFTFDVSGNTSAVRVFKTPDRSIPVSLPIVAQGSSFPFGVYFIEGVNPSIAPQDVLFEYRYDSPTVTCADQLAVTVADAQIDFLSHRLSETVETAYILPGDVEHYTVTGSVPDNDLYYLVVSDPNIAKFRIEDQDFDFIKIAGFPIDVSLHGIEAGETTVEVRLGSENGPSVCEGTPVAVGGTIRFEIDSLLYYHPSPQGPAAAGGEPLVDNVAEANGFVLPLETVEAANDRLVSKAKMYWRVTVEDLTGNKMIMQDVAVVQVPSSEYPGGNQLDIEFDSSTTDVTGRVRGNTQLQGETLDVPQYEYKLIVLVGELARNYRSDPDSIPESDWPLLFSTTLKPFDARVTNGRLMRFERVGGANTPDGLGISAALSVELPYIGGHTYAILGDFFDNFLDNRQAGIVHPDLDSQPEIPADESWRLIDATTEPPGLPIGLTSEFWDPPGPREITFGPQSEWPMDRMIAGFPDNDELSQLIVHFLQELNAPVRYVPEPIDDEPLGPHGGQLISISIAVAEFAGGMLTYGDAIDVVKGVWSYLDGQEMTWIDNTVFITAALGLSSDLGQLFAGLGIPANVATAMVKAVIKATDAVLLRHLIRWLGGGYEAVKALSQYLAKFIPADLPLTDYIKPNVLIDFLKSGIGQFLRVVQSPLVKANQTIEEIAATFAATIKIMLTRGRSLSDDAAEGVASFVRHGEGSDEALTELFDLLPANVADDSAESIGEAVGKSHRSQLAPDIDPNLSPDDFGVQRADDAIRAARQNLDPHLRGIVDGFIGPGRAIKSKEEFEALRFMAADSLTAAQKDAIVEIRQAIPSPSAGAPMQKVIKGSDININIAENRNVRGFVATQADAGSSAFQSSDEMIEGLRLDGPAGFENESSVGIIEWDLDSPSEINIPFGDGFSSSNPVAGQYPFIGNGFTGTTQSGRLVPEYRVPAGAEIILPDGAKLYSLDGAGNKVLRATRVNDEWITP